MDETGESAFPNNCKCYLLGECKICDAEVTLVLRVHEHEGKTCFTPVRRFNDGPRPGDFVGKDVALSKACESKGHRKALGVSEDDYAEMLDHRDGKCWICGRAEPTKNRTLAVDHDHRTGAVRGLLCTACNRRLGATTDSEWLRRAAEYLDLSGHRFGDECDCGIVVRKWEFVSGDGTGGSLLRYRCECGATWTCTWQTRGMPRLFG